MAETRQFLRLTIAGIDYLLPSTAGYTIEQRDNMQVNASPNSRVSGWRVTRASRWPAYALERGFQVTRRDDWQRAVFVEAAPNAIGVIVDEVQVLPRSDMPVAAFTPLGEPPTRAGHLFSGAAVQERRVTLVLEPRALVAYLQGIGE